MTCNCLFNSCLLNCWLNAFWIRIAIFIYKSHCLWCWWFSFGAGLNPLWSAENSLMQEKKKTLLIRTSDVSSDPGYWSNFCSYDWCRHAGQVHFIRAQSNAQTPRLDAPCRFVRLFLMESYYSVSLLFLFLSCSYLSWTLEGSLTKAQRVTAPPLDFFVLNVVFTCVVALFIDQVWWVLSSLPSLSWEDLWWWGLPGTQQASWEVCPPWPCVPQVRSSLTWAGPWLSALEWSSRPPSVSIMQFHLINPVSAALQTVLASRFSYKWDKWARIWLRKGRFQQ